MFPIWREISLIVVLNASSPPHPLENTRIYRAYTTIHPVHFMVVILCTILTECITISNQHSNAHARRQRNIHDF